MRPTTLVAICAAVILTVAGLTIAVVTLTSTDTAPATSTSVPLSTSPPPMTTALSEPVVAVTPTITTTVTEPGTSSPPVSSSSGTTGGRHDVPTLTEEQRRDPTSVATAFVVAITGFDTSTDVDRTAGATRGADLMTPDLAFALTTPDPFASTTQWAEWTAAGAWTTVTTRKTEIPWLPADSRTTAVRAIGYVVTIHYADGTQEDQPTQTLAVTMTRSDAGGPWLVTSTEVP